MVESSAMAVYRAPGAAAARRPSLHTARLPISHSCPASRSSAKELGTKSDDRELSAQCKRRAPSRAPAPRAKAAPSRELAVPQLTRISRSASPHSQCVYSTATRPTPPAPACSSSTEPAAGVHDSRAVCTVLQVVGSVQAPSGESRAGVAASSRASDRASDARAPLAYPSAAHPFVKKVAAPPSATSRTAQSAPGGPASPGQLRHHTQVADGAPRVEVKPDRAGQGRGSLNQSREELRATADRNFGLCPAQAESSARAECRGWPRLGVHKPDHGQGRFRPHAAGKTDEARMGAAGRWQAAARAADPSGEEERRRRNPASREGACHRQRCRKPNERGRVTARSGLEDEHANSAAAMHA
eukprot:scaffold31815_cov118-Isochrysis_galbana.AAC.6